ncbi:glutathione S-transferase family protein [Erythrobacter sp. F6033]|uniref:glutathione S-transferase family protein n=1 Tax=Erythrobacter sp. F6033 TaxID=2926401 RepID=UPI001FF600F8|nr:glutathione S-transferase family protein [Erythrobacter sp. F6033]MCK0129560.1 glutathione S-transferase [Erythrobacter sp. F6033]
MTNTMYGSPASLFSGKARAYLDWKGADYVEIAPNLQIRNEVIVPAIGRMIIPVVETEDGAVLQDTSLIIDHFEKTLGGPSIYPDTPRQHFAARLLECFGDEWLVLPAMHYRWNYNEEWILEEFGRNMMPDAPRDQQIAAGAMIGKQFRGFVPMLGINDTTIPAIEASYEALLADLDAHFADHPFLFGSRPSIGDYGLIGPLYAHLYRDPASGKIMKRLAPRVAEWVERMVSPETPLSGDFLLDDEIPETLLPILARMMREHVPFLGETANLLESWLQENPEAEIPRGVGMASFTIEGVQGEGIARTFSLWMLQRALDHFESLEGNDRAACEALLEEVGGEALIKFSMPVRLAYENHTLVAAKS